MTRTVKEIFQELENMENDNAKLIKKRQEELEAIGPTIEKAKQDIVEAKKKVDAEAYNKAKTELWTAGNTKELLEEELEKLQNNPLVSKKEYHKLAKEITAAAESVNAEILRRCPKIYLVVNKDDLHNPKLGSKEKPVPALLWYTDPNYKNYEVSEENYRHSVKEYLTYCRTE